MMRTDDPRGPPKTTSRSLRASSRSNRTLSPRPAPPPMSSPNLSPFDSRRESDDMSVYSTASAAEPAETSPGPSRQLTARKVLMPNIPTRKGSADRSREVSEDGSPPTAAGKNDIKAIASAIAARAQSIAAERARAAREHAGLSPSSSSALGASLSASNSEASLAADTSEASTPKAIAFGVPPEEPYPAAGVRTVVSSTGRGAATSSARGKGVSRAPEGGMATEDSSSSAASEGWNVSEWADFADVVDHVRVDDRSVPAAEGARASEDRYSATTAETSLQASSRGSKGSVPGSSGSSADSAHSRRSRKRLSPEGGESSHDTRGAYGLQGLGIGGTGSAHVPSGSVESGLPRSSSERSVAGLSKDGVTPSSSGSTSKTTPDSFAKSNSFSPAPGSSSSSSRMNGGTPPSAGIRRNKRPSALSINTPSSQNSLSPQPVNKLAASPSGRGKTTPPTNPPAEPLPPLPPTPSTVQRSRASYSREGRSSTSQRWSQADDRSSRGSSLYSDSVQGADDTFSPGAQATALPYAARAPSPQGGNRSRARAESEAAKQLMHAMESDLAYDAKRDPDHARPSDSHKQESRRSDETSSSSSSSAAPAPTPRRRAHDDHRNGDRDVDAEGEEGLYDSEDEVEGAVVHTGTKITANRGSKATPTTLTRLSGTALMTNLHARSHSRSTVSSPAPSLASANGGGSQSQGRAAGGEGASTATGTKASNVISKALALSNPSPRAADEHPGRGQRGQQLGEAATLSTTNGRSAHSPVQAPRRRATQEEDYRALSMDGSEKSGGAISSRKGSTTLAEIVAALKKLQYEKRTLEKIIRATTPLDGLGNVEGLGQYLTSMSLQVEQSGAEVRKLLELLERQRSVMDYMAETHQLEIDSHIADSDDLKDALELAIQQAELNSAEMARLAVEQDKSNTALVTARAETLKVRAMLEEEERLHKHAAEALRQTRDELEMLQRAKTRQGDHEERGSRANSEDDTHARFKAMREDSEDKIREVEGRLAIARKEIEMQSNRIQELEAKLAQAQEAETQMEQDRDEVEARLADATDEAEAKMEHALQEAEELRLKLESKESGHSNEVNQLKLKLETMRAELQDQHARNLQQIREEHAKAIETLESNSLDALEEMKNSHADIVSELEAQVVQLKDALIYKPAGGGAPASPVGSDVSLAKDGSKTPEDNARDPKKQSLMTPKGSVRYSVALLHAQEQSQKMYTEMSEVISKNLALRQQLSVLEQKLDKQDQGHTEVNLLRRQMADLHQHNELRQRELCDKLEEAQAAHQETQAKLTALREKQALPPLPGMTSRRTSMMVGARAAAASGGAPPVPSPVLKSMQTSTQVVPPQMASSESQTDTSMLSSAEAQAPDMTAAAERISLAERERDDLRRRVDQQDKEIVDLRTLIATTSLPPVTEVRAPVGGPADERIDALRSQLSEQRARETQIRAAYKHIRDELRKIQHAQTFERRAQGGGVPMSSFVTSEGSYGSSSASSVAGGGGGGGGSPSPSSMPSARLGNGNGNNNGGIVPLATSSGQVEIVTRSGQHALERPGTSADTGETRSKRQLKRLSLPMAAKIAQQQQQQQHGLAGGGGASPLAMAMSASADVARRDSNASGLSRADSTMTKASSLGGGAGGGFARGVGGASAATDHDSAGDKDSTADGAASNTGSAGGGGGSAARHVPSPTESTAASSAAARSPVSAKQLPPDPPFSGGGMGYVHSSAPDVGGDVGTTAAGARRERRAAPPPTATRKSLPGLPPED